MATPAFIYAFDNLGSEKFTELSGLLLGARHKGFLLGGVGPDGGEDGTIDDSFGEWHAESTSPLLNELIQPGQLVIFQFKHKVVGRLGGQTEARSGLLEMYACGEKKSRQCELHRRLIQEKHPYVYVLVTNVEVNALFRNKFIKRCQEENPDIKKYQIIGLDELEMWVTMMPELRHLYFPTIFGPPRFELRVKLDYARPTEVFPPFDKHDPRFVMRDAFCVSVMNVGLVSSYVGSIQFLMLVDGELQFHSCKHEDFGGGNAGYISSCLGDEFQPGRKKQFFFSFNRISATMQKLGSNVFPVEVHIHDEIGNIYNVAFPEEMSNELRIDNANTNS